MRYAAIDIGNVCIAIDKNAPLRGMGIDSLDVFGTKLLELVQLFEHGKISEDEFFDLLCQLPECKNSSREKIISLYDSILVSPVPGMQQLLMELPEMGVTPVFFSDISTFHLEGSRKRFPEMRNFDGIYSYVYGVYKPSKVLFDAFEAKYGKPVVYADDRMELITAARENNWNAHCFVSADELKTEIIKALESI